MKVISVVGARPNFMKIAPFIAAIEAHNQSENIEPIEHVLVHTGQHYDIRMSHGFFEELDIPHPQVNLEVGSGSHAEQLGNTMIAFEKALLEIDPDWVVVVGDVNATLSCSVVAKRHGVKVCHIEAGLRSNDIKMPEEINRLVTDKLSDLLLTPDRLSVKNLKAEGFENSRIDFVGNIMIDTLEKYRDEASNLSIQDILGSNGIEGSVNDVAGVEEEKYCILTMHRPSNVDEHGTLEEILRFLVDEVAPELHLLWPVHPRTKGRLAEFGLWDEVLANPKIILLEPLSYKELLRLNLNAKMAFTDSGGLQEECCVLGTPCLTLRWNTERPVTLREHGGVSVLLGNNVPSIRKEYQNAMQLTRMPQSPELWDGKTAKRCVESLVAADLRTS